MIADLFQGLKLPHNLAERLLLTLHSGVLNPVCPSSQASRKTCTVYGVSKGPDAYVLHSGSQHVRTGMMTQ